jgi:dihydroxyacetone kinase-like predicted kinase
MGLGDGGLLAVGEDVEQTTLETIANMADEDSEVISVYYGSDINPEQAGQLREKLEEAYPDMEIEIYEGGQPIYYYIVSVE